MKTNLKARFGIFALLTLALGCSKSDENKNSPLVLGDVKSEVLSSDKMSAHGRREALAIRSEIVVSKEAILGREFLYGSDLQYSSKSDADYGLVLQTITVGHVPSHFVIRGKNLQLVADQKINFESDINHPEKLLQQFRILQQDDEQLTIEVLEASTALVTVLGDAKTPAPRQSWVRSVDFVVDNNMLLIESSIENNEGVVAEFMESIIPRPSLVPESFSALLMDAARQPLAKRFRFLSWGPVFLNFDKERVKTQVASRYDVANNKTIDWYVTPNIPAEFIPDVKTAVESWNRYSQKMWKRDFVLFKGLLPADVKLGDPRYNVISWDSVAKAGAAYASTASDPTTGVISHGLIYMPYAWINIAKEYWSKGKFSERSEKTSDKMRALVDKGSFLGKKLNVSCFMDAGSNLTLGSKKDPELFARELLKAVIMHEVGHTLGLNHNFKASLVYDPNQAGSAFSTSIMDYNQYNIEAAFDSVDSANGLLLEYDRQIISALYNDAKDVSETDVKLPACDDEESDSEEGGVDPLCTRYDAGYDPTLYMQGIRSLFENESFAFGPMKSLTQAIGEIKQELSDASQFTSQEAVKKEIEKIVASTRGTLGFYVTGNANSINYLTRANLRLLKTFKDKSLPETFNEKELRARALEGVEYVRTLKALPDAPLKAFQELHKSLQLWIERTAYFLALDPGKKSEEMDKLTAEFKALPEKMAGNDGDFAKTRTALWGAIKRSEKAPFEIIDGKDFESIIIEHLAEAVTEAFDGKPRSQLERVAATKALYSFAGVTKGEETVEAVKTKIAAQIAQSSQAKEREALRALLKILAGEEEKTEEG